MTAKRRTALQRNKDKRSSMRASIFPDLDQSRVWDIKNITKTKGYTSIPRTMPIIGSIADLMAGKGTPVASTYLELWCRSDEQGFVIVNKHSEIAFASGFSGERGVSTWKQRVRKLEALGFISIKPGSSGDIHYVQIWNPYLVIRDHAAANTDGFSEKHYHTLLERHYDIGALDLELSAEAEEEPAVEFKPKKNPVRRKSSARQNAGA